LHCGLGVVTAAETIDPVESAEAAGLRYVGEAEEAGPAIRRRRAGRGFSYRGPDERPITDKQVLARIKALAIPPAWTDVWICPDPKGHIQATGRDAKGRKQYRYHPRWREVRDAAKYERLAEFAQALPRIRQRTDADLRRHGIPREKVLAVVVRLLEETSIRVGNDEYARQNRSFGLTTLRDRHAVFEGEKLRFEFRGKAGKQHTIELNDRRLARIVKRCQDIPGQELFQYLDAEGKRHTIESADVNAYIREISGGHFTAKDFRTWNGTVLASRYLRVCERGLSPTAAKRQVSQAIKSVASSLGNTPAVCRKAYVHPVVVNAYLEGSLEPEAGVSPTPNGTPQGLTDEEQCVLELLRATAKRLAA
jgi:DNA topoisomerase-1